MNNIPYIAPIARMENLFFDKKRYWSVINNSLHRRHLGLRPYQWDQHIFMPCALWLYLYRTELFPVFLREFTSHINYSQMESLLIANLSTLTAWRYTQGVYFLAEDLVPDLLQDERGQVISQAHINNMNEWAVCIDSHGLDWFGQPLKSFFAQKNVVNFDNKKQDCLILLFHTLPAQEPVAYPYVVLSYDQNGSIEHALLSFGGMEETVTAQTLAQALKPFLAIFNAIFDPSTLIESEVVGVKQPHHSNIEKHINYNSFNVPTFKYAAPSNVRLWHCGGNHVAEIQYQRRNHNLQAQMQWSQDQTGLHLTVK